jgi:hypothetical protein
VVAVVSYVAWEGNEVCRMGYVEMRDVSGRWSVGQHRVLRREFR